MPSISLTRSTTRAACLPIALAGLALPAVLSAQVELDAITVEQTTEDGTGPVAGQTNPVTRAGSKAETPLLEVPQSVSIVGAETLDDQNITRVSEALRYVPGVFTDVYGDDADYDWHFIRGFQADQTGVFWDDMQNLAFAFGSFFVDPYTLERIEVLRGPSSALYGGASPGGLLNYVSKRPGGRTREVSLGLSDEVRGWAGVDVGDELDNGGAWRLLARVEGGERHDDFNDGFRGVLSPSYTQRLNDTTELTLIANVVGADEKHSGGSFLPYVGTVEPTTQFGFIDTEANFSDPDWDSYLREQTTLTGIVEHDLNDDWSLFGTARVGVASVEESYFYPIGYAESAPQPADDDPDGTLSLLAFEHDSLVRTAQTDVRATGFATTGAVEHDLLFGLDLRTYELDETQASGTGFSSPGGNPVEPGIPTLDDPYVDGTTTQDQLGLYWQDQLRFGDGWITTLNLRQDFATTETDGLVAFDRDDDETSGRVGLSYRLANDVVPFVSYSTFFNPLIASPDQGVTKPESGDQIELGMKWAPSDGERYLGVSLFSIDKNNVVTGPFDDRSQIGEVRSRGIEIEGRLGTRPGLSVQAFATLIDLEVRDDADASLIGNRLTLVPEVQISARAGYGFTGALNGLEIGAGVRYLGESEADPANTEQVPDATVVDLGANYDIDGWGLDLAISNVADERYVTGCNGLTVCSYGEGREFNVTLTRQF